MDLKKICLAIAAVVLIICGISFFKDKSPAVDKTASDYEIIEAVHKEMDSLKSSSMLSKGGVSGQWNIYELGLMYQKDDEFFKKMRTDLGEDFKWKLSDGDSIFIGVLPHNNSYRIYAGKPDDSHMLYPDWNYEKLAKK